MSDENAEALAALDGVSQSGESDVVSAPQGQAASAPVTGQATEKPFFSHKWDDGKEEAWKTEDDLRRHLREGHLRHSDYTKKTQQVAEARKLADDQRRSYESKERTFNESYSKIMGMDKFLKENPQVAERIATEMKGTRGNSDLERLLGERMKPIEEKLSEYEKEKERMADEKARNEAYESVAKRYPDFNRTNIDDALRRLEEVPEQLRQEYAIELLHLAEKGRLTPGAIERKQAMVSNKPRSSTPTSAVGIPDRQVSAMNREEEMAIALAAMEAAAG